jgi:Planctomycete cytochrome C
LLNVGQTFEGARLPIMSTRLRGVFRVVSLLIPGLGFCAGLGGTNCRAVKVGEAAAKPDPAAVDFFEAKVRPVLAAHCWECHGPDKQKSGLRVDSRGAALKGGETGPAVVIGKPEESLLVEAIG